MSENMNAEDVSKFVKFLRSLPVWARIVIVAVVAAIASVALFLPTSCSTIRTTVSGSSKVSTSVNQSALDSAKITISIEPKF